MNKLFENDSYLTRFTARVLSCAQGKKGYDVTLDQTAFFPEGGGQPYDTGTLGGVQVLEVHDRGGQIVHTCAAPLEVGSQVEGIVDWERRLDHMQQHSGEHIVSGLAHAKYGCDNVGFHMGSDVVTIDLNVELDQQQLEELELEANRYLWQDRPVQLLYPTSDELERMDYRSKKAIQGQVRIVTFPGVDTCACCGTHVRSAGQVGLIKLLSVQRFRDGVRIELVCGGRALRYGGPEPPYLQPVVHQGGGDRPRGGASVGGEPPAEGPPDRHGGRPLPRSGGAVHRGRGCAAV